MTIITADHGEILGERIIFCLPRLYEHQPISILELLNVPLYIIESENSGDVSLDKPIEYQQETEKVIEDRLAVLGYKEKAEANSIMIPTDFFWP